jgi:hypothetical protein
MKISSILTLTMTTTLLFTSCSKEPSTSGQKVVEKSDKQIAIEKVCGYVTPNQVNDIYGARVALSELVQLDASYMPLLEEMAGFISVLSERTGYPKQYPDLQLLKSFCSSLNE